MDIDTLLRFRGRDVVDSEGSKIGTLDEIYLDDSTGEPEWALINTGLFGTRSNFAPLAQAKQHGDDLLLPYAKDKVKDAPGVDSGQHLDPDQEAELYRYYELSSTGTSEARTESGTDTVGHDTSGPTTDDSMTRSEEEVRVGKTQRDAGPVRLRKYVVLDEDADSRQ
jgi:sporulation protein YlmC with PRC-barrel domain